MVYNYYNFRNTSFIPWFINFNGRSCFGCWRLEARLSNFASTFISFGIETSTDFAVNQIYDSLNFRSDSKSTVLNLLPEISGVGKLTRAARTTIILKLAKKTKLLEKLGVITTNNLEDVVRQVAGQKVLSDKLIFDFTKRANNETLLYTIGKLAVMTFIKVLTIIK
ncbi:hypothetical protein [Spiroplasma endosymbiont of Polydrusus formosus]|uniref:hypothetical protein n=1 Tax=Spiroplasma endosymbiont of Polydrusus formosus TaxID=3139326 RepID=UPI0035B55A84